MSESASVFQDAKTYDIRKLSEAFRRPLPTDGRYVSLSRQPQPPINAITSKGCDFKFPPIADIYLIDDIKIVMSVRLATKDSPHIRPTNGAQVGPCNDVISSVISEIKLTVNNTKGR